MNGVEVGAYLERIGLPARKQPPTAEWLRTLHRAHLSAVPFENLDIARGRSLTLEPAALFAKIVERRRGGICYELNGLFALLLEAQGYEVRRLSASVAKGEGQWGPAFDHLTLEVLCPADAQPSALWLADVGWGDSFLDPIRLDNADWQPEGRRAYRLEADGDGFVLWQRDFDGDTERQYRFARTPHALARFAPMCVYHQVSPRSSFTQGRLCTRATAQGRITIRGQRLITTTNFEREVALFDETALPALLDEHFGIQMDS